MQTQTAEAGPSTPRRGVPAMSPAESSQFDRWRASLSELTGLGLNEQEKAERDERIAQKRLEGEWEHCEKTKRELMERSKHHRPNGDICPGGQG